MVMSLKHVVSGGVNDLTLEPEKQYKIELYEDKVPIQIRLKYKKEEPQVYIVVQNDNSLEEDDDDKYE